MNNTDPFMLPDWNTDQALLWLATRDAALVLRADDADPMRRPTVTWITVCWQYPDADEIEATLLGYLQTGQLKTRYEQHGDMLPVDPSWFARASYHFDRELIASFQRTDLTATAAVVGPLPVRQYAIREIRPRFEPTALRDLVNGPASRNGKGRPSLMKHIEGELDAWIGAGREYIKARLADASESGKGKAAISRALRCWAEKRFTHADDDVPTAGRIESVLRAKLGAADEIL